ncbi:bzip transcription factor [Ophiostoma piceae UAMH 11346]|uniref:Bzip transcription factor n=1 Tax=Ophiostoma piceae (strain UAMH 11346) TaxID=1262450 RepID=S3C6X5_OPHP1|nr:bzip transcription factor [Ophiostoma piceae UAMH 11346]
MMSIKQESDAQSSTMTDNMSTTSAANQNGMMDPIDSLLDLSEYDNTNQFNSPALSPANSKHSFVRTTAASTPASMLSASQPMSGPSHQYDQYKQQTGFVPGALANTFAVTQNGNPQMPGYSNFDMNFMNMNSTDEIFDFNTAPPASVSPSDIDVDFESPDADPSLFFAEQMSSSAPSVNMAPSVLPGQAHSLQSPPVVPTNDVPGNVGRLWPGMHQQAAMAKAQAQQRQQQQIIQQQQMQRQRQNGAMQGQMKPMAAPQAQGQSQRAKAGQPSDPIVEQKITQLLSSMRAKPPMPHTIGNNGMVNMSRPKKDEDDMDDDERLLASEEGKRLTSKERRQLRNKVSARAFRSRRKEYITQLEAEIAGKVTENGELRTQNRALAEENKRLSDLTRMLLGSPSFSDFLDRLSSNPALVPQVPAQAPQVQERQAPKDANSYSAQHQIGMAMIPEQNIDFSMLQMETEPSFSYQPQVYAVLETPDVASSLDASILSGKGSNFVGSFDDDEKVDMPILENPIIEKAVEAIQSRAAAVHDAEFENDPAFDLYHDAPAAATSSVAVPTESASTGKPVELNTEVMSEVGIFGGIETEKAFARFELVDASEEAAREFEESVALARIARMCAGLKATTERLENMISRD